MAANIIVMPGSARLDFSSLASVASEFGCKVEVAENPDQVAAMDRSSKVVAVLFHLDAFGLRYTWGDAIRLLRVGLPNVPLIPLHGFSEPVDWPELCDAGAFHSLWLPLKENEVRQSLGFLALALRTPAKSMVRAGQ